MRPEKHLACLPSKSLGFPFVCVVDAAAIWQQVVHDGGEGASAAGAATVNSKDCVPFPFPFLTLGFGVGFLMGWGKALGTHKVWALIIRGDLKIARVRPTCVGQSDLYSGTSLTIILRERDKIA